MPSYSKCEFHFLVENDKSVKISKAPLNKLYVYFALYPFKKCRVKITVDFESFYQIIHFSNIR